MVNGNIIWTFLHKYNIYSYIKMNNILTFEDYRKMNIRQVESVIYRQFIEEIKDENEMNEGFIRNAINKASGKFIHKALADEIEKGKELEKSIKDALDGLNRGFEEIEKKIDNNKNPNPNSNLNAIEKVKEAIKSVQSQTFDTLTMIGSEGEIDFAGFMGSATVSATANFGILFSPIRSLFITRKAYKYFLNIIKQTIRRNLLVIQLNFDQFENLILQKSFESEEDSEDRTIRDTMIETLAKLQEHLCKDNMFKSDRKKKELSTRIRDFKTIFDAQLKSNKENFRNNPYRSLWQDQYNNTYTKTLEQIKQYVNDDSQKELDALKNSITKMAGNDVELAQYGELLISAAEEYAIKTNHGINNNFIKMSSVFNLDNQKKLIDLIVATQKENEEEIKKKQEQKLKRKERSDIKKKIKDGKKLYEEKLKDKRSYTYEKFEDTFSKDDIICLKSFFQTDEGKEPYKELIKKNHLYKYYIEDITELDTFLSTICEDLKIIEISDIGDFFSSIVNKEQALYYMMAERSIKDAIKSTQSDKYFGFKDITNGDVDDKNTLIANDDKKTKIFNSILNKNSIITKKGKKISVNKPKYFLTFTGSGEKLFNILHKDFKTKIFKNDKTYLNDISTENKEIIMKLIYKNFKIGNSISTQFAEYLVRLEAHMLLEKRDRWFVVENNDELKNCFKPNSTKILNKKAFVEIKQEDYENIKSFITKLKNLYDNDFILESEEDDKTTNK